MNKKLIRLTESELHKIVKETVNRILNEVSDDTLSSAIDASDEKVERYIKKYGENSEATKAAKNQRQNFKDEHLKRYMSANQRKRGRMEKNEKDRIDGNRTYVNGIGWRTKK